MLAKQGSASRLAGLARAQTFEQTVPMSRCQFLFGLHKCRETASAQQDTTDDRRKRADETCSSSSRMEGATPSAQLVRSTKQFQGPVNLPDPRQRSSAAAHASSQPSPQPNRGLSRPTSLSIDIILVVEVVQLVSHCFSRPLSVALFRRSGGRSIASFS